MLRLRLKYQHRDICFITFYYQTESIQQLCGHRSKKRLIELGGI